MPHPPSLDSTIACEQFFPLTIEFGTQHDLCRFAEYSFGDSDVLDFILNWETRFPEKMTLVICGHYRIVDASAPETILSEANSTFPDLRTTECKTFNLSIFKDGVALKLSNVQASNHCRIGQAIFEFSPDQELVQIWITKMSEKEIEHLKGEITE